MLQSGRKAKARQLQAGKILRNVPSLRICSCKPVSSQVRSLHRQNEEVSNRANQNAIGGAEQRQPRTLSRKQSSSLARFWKEGMHGGQRDNRDHYGSTFHWKSDQISRDRHQRTKLLRNSPPRRAYAAPDPYLDRGRFRAIYVRSRGTCMYSSTPTSVTESKQQVVAESYRCRTGRAD